MSYFNSASGHEADDNKRKFQPDEEKCYVVKVGKKPGIYRTWPEVLFEIEGVKYPVYRKFSTRAEAEAFLNGDAHAKAGTFYGVQTGRVPGVYTDWPMTQMQIKGFKGAKFKKFPNRGAAEAFVDEGRQSDRRDMVKLASYMFAPPDDAASEASLSDARAGCKEPGAKKVKNNDGASVRVAAGPDLEPGTGELPDDAEDGFDHTVILNPDSGQLEHKSEQQLTATKLVQKKQGEPLVINCDGSAKSNGREVAHAGIGVWFGKGDPRNVSEPLPGPRQTNNRAELWAVHRALNIAPIDQDVLIRTDSMYAIKSVAQWSKNWLKNGFKNSKGKSVENKDLIEPLIGRYQERTKAGAETRFEWVRGHYGDDGNSCADALATKGCELKLIEIHMEWCLND